MSQKQAFFKAFFWILGLGFMMFGVIFYVIYERLKPVCSSLYLGKVMGGDKTHKNEPRKSLREYRLAYRSKR